MAPHSSTLAWKIPWTEEPGGLQSRGSLRVGHDWATSLSLSTFMHWRRKWQPSPVFLPGESQGWGESHGLPSVGSHRVGHDWSDLAAAAAAVKWDGWMASPTWWTWVWISSWREFMMDREAWCAAVHEIEKVRHEWATELYLTDLYSKDLCSKDSTSAHQQCCITRCFLALSFSPLFCLMISQI